MNIEELDKLAEKETDKQKFWMTMLSNAVSTNQPFDTIEMCNEKYLIEINKTKRLDALRFPTIISTSDDRRAEIIEIIKGLSQEIDFINIVNNYPTTFTLDDDWFEISVGSTSSDKLSYEYANLDIIDFCNEIKYEKGWMV